MPAVTWDQRAEDLDAAHIDLECPKCKRQYRAVRINDEDPPEAVKAQILCPECCDGDFGSTTYFDKDGRELEVNHS